MPTVDSKITTPQKRMYVGYQGFRTISEKGYARTNTLFAYFFCCHLTNMSVRNMQSHADSPKTRFSTTPQSNFTVEGLIQFQRLPSAFDSPLINLAFTGSVSIAFSEDEVCGQTFLRDVAAARRHHSLAKHRRGTGEIRMTEVPHSQLLPYWLALRFCRNMPSGMLVSTHHHEVGIPQVCFVITKRTARMRTQLISRRLSAQRFLHLGIIHLSMQDPVLFLHTPTSQSVTSGQRSVRVRRHAQGLLRGRGCSLSVAVHDNPCANQSNTTCAIR